jgi:hypothetical protein
MENANVVHFASKTVATGVGGASFVSDAFAVNAGNLLLMGIHFANPTGVLITGVSDSLGSTRWKKALMIDRAQHENYSFEWWYAWNLDASGSAVVTVALSGNHVGVWDMTLTEVQGVVTTSDPVNVHGALTYTQLDTLTSAQFDTTFEKQILFAVGLSPDTEAWANGSGWVEVGQNTKQTQYLQSKYVEQYLTNNVAVMSVVHRSSSASVSPSASTSMSKSPSSSVSPSARSSASVSPTASESSSMSPSASASPSTPPEGQSESRSVSPSASDSASVSPSASASDAEPDPFSFDPVTNSDKETEYEPSANTTLSGVDIAVTVTIASSNAPAAVRVWEGADWSAWASSASVPPGEVFQAGIYAPGPSTPEVYTWCIVSAGNQTAEYRVYGLPWNA